MTKIKRIIKAGGGSQAIASKIGTTRQAVNKWVRVPSGRVKAVSKLTGYTKRHIRPDLY